MKYLLNHPALSMALLIIGTFLLYIVFYFIANCRFEYVNPGLFGDFMGGVIGTILTAVAAIFIYSTYRTQKKQLKTQKKEFELQRKEANQALVSSLYEGITKEINDLEVTCEQDSGKPITYKGIYVLYNFSKLYKDKNQDKNRDNNVLDMLNLLLISFEHLFKLTKDSTYKWKMQLQINQDKNYLLLYSKIIWPLHKFYQSEWEKLIQMPKPHADSIGTKTRYESLVKECFEYLGKRELIGKPEGSSYEKFWKDN